jgi:hypothetical protein
MGRETCGDHARSGTAAVLLDGRHRSTHGQSRLIAQYQQESQNDRALDLPTTLDNGGVPADRADQGGNDTLIIWGKEISAR